MTAPQGARAKVLPAAVIAAMAPPLRRTRTLRHSHTTHRPSQTVFTAPRTPANLPPGLLGVRAVTIVSGGRCRTCTTLRRARRGVYDHAAARRRSTLSLAYFTGAPTAIDPAPAITLEQAQAIAEHDKPTGKPPFSRATRRMHQRMVRTQLRKQSRKRQTSKR